MLLEPHALGMAVIRNALDIGGNHLQTHVQGEEGRPLAAPVVVEHDAVQLQDVQVMVDHTLVHLAELGEEGMDRILLLFVNQRKGGVFKIHKADEPLENTILEGDVQAAGGLVQNAVQSAALVPVQSVDIRELDDFRPIVGIQQGRVAGLHHAAAHSGHVDPVNAEKVLAALFLVFIGRTHVHDFRPGHMIQVGPGFQIAEIRGTGEPIGLFPADAHCQVFLRCDRSVVLRSFAAEKPPAEGGGVDVLADYLKFGFGKGFSAHNLPPNYVVLLAQAFLFLYFTLSLIPFQPLSEISFTGV